MAGAHSIQRRLPAYQHVQLSLPQVRVGNCINTPLHHTYVTANHKARRRSQRADLRVREPDTHLPTERNTPAPEGQIKALRTG